MLLVLQAFLKSMTIFLCSLYVFGIRPFFSSYLCCFVLISFTLSPSNLCNFSIFILYSRCTYLSSKFFQFFNKKDSNRFTITVLIFFILFLISDSLLFSSHNKNIPYQDEMPLDILIPHYNLCNADKPEPIYHLQYILCHYIFQCILLLCPL